MTLLRRLASILRWLVRRGRAERDLDDELEAFVDMAAADKMALGTSAGDARRLARLDLGGIEQTKERVRSGRYGAWIDETARDVRYALRMCARTPGFSVVVIITLALGIGASTAIFSVVDALLVRPLPVRDPATLVQITTNGASGSANYPWFKTVAERADVFSDVVAIRHNLFKVQVGETIDLIPGHFVTGNYHQALGIGAVLGRTLLPEDQTDAGSRPVAVISHAYWQRRFGGDPAVLGRSILVDRAPYTIIGVTPPAFFGVQVGWTMDVTLPLIAARYRDPRNWFTMPIVARLRPGIEPSRAGAEVDAMLNRFLTVHGAPDRSRRPLLQHAAVLPFSNGLGTLREEFSKPLGLLMAAVALLLLVACANVAGLLVARNAAREREFTIRLALGARRLQIIRQLLAECAILAILGGIPALVLAWQGSNLLLTVIPQHWGPPTISIEPDGRILAFALATTVATIVLFGLLPAFQATRGVVSAALATRLRQVARLRIGVSRCLVVTQIALSLVLVAGALLFVQTLANLERVDGGFSGENVLIARIDEPGAGYDNDNMRRFQGEMRERLAALPGVFAATVATITPGNGNEDRRRITVSGFEPPQDDDATAQVDTVGSSYFDVFRIPILEGRAIDARDRAGAPPVTVVSETFARHYFGGASAIGRHVTVGAGPSAPSYEIVGVAGEVQYGDVRVPMRRLLYLATAQAVAGRPAYYEFAIRTNGAPASMIQAVRAEIRRVRPDAPILGVLPLKELARARLSRERLLAFLATFFGVAALIVTAVGTYGLMAYVVARQEREIGVRLALGAHPGRILWTTIVESLTLGGLGTAIGLAASVVVFRTLHTLLFGLSPTDATTLLAVAALLLTVGTLAALLPARRAARTDPLLVLRSE